MKNYTKLLSIFFLIFTIISCDNSLLSLKSETDASKISDPVITVSSVESADSITVTIKSETSGALIRYTTDGRNPSKDSGNSLVNGGQFVLKNTGEYNIKAIAYKDDYRDSDITSRIIKINGTLPVPVLTPNTIFSSPGQITITVSPGSTVEYTMNGVQYSTTQSLVITIYESTTIIAKTVRSNYKDSAEVTRTYTYTGQCPPPALSMTTLFNAPSKAVIYVPESAGGITYSVKYTVDRSDPNISLTAKTITSDTEIELGENTITRIRAITTAVNWKSSAIVSNIYTVTGRLPLPVFKINDEIMSNDSYINTAEYQVEFNIPSTHNSSPLTDVKLFYTIDGSSPSLTNGIEALHGDKITIKNIDNALTKKTVTVSAFLYKPEWIDSPMAAKTFHITGKLQPPDIGYNQISSNEPVIVSLSVKNENADIYYTTDGTSPTKENGIKYTRNIVITSSEPKQVRAIAILDEWETSKISIMNGFRSTGVWDYEDWWYNNEILPGQMYQPAHITVRNNKIWTLDEKGLSVFNAATEAFEKRINKEFSIYNVVDFNVDSAGNIYILELDTKILKKYDSDFENPVNFEYNLYDSFSIDSDDNIYVNNSSYTVDVLKNDDKSIIKTIGAGEAAAPYQENRFFGTVLIAVDLDNNLHTISFTDAAVFYQKFADTGILISHFYEVDSSNLIDSGVPVKISASENFVVLSFRGVDHASFTSLVFKNDEDMTFVKKITSIRGTGNGQFDHGPKYSQAVSGDFIYICDQYNSRLQKIKVNGFFSGMISTDAPPKQFRSIQSIWADQYTNLIYIADTNNHRVQVFDSNGNFIRFIGKPGSGKGEFFKVTGVTTDREGNVWAADYKLKRLHKFDKDGNFLLVTDDNIEYPDDFELPTGIITNSNNELIMANEIKWRNNYGVSFQEIKKLSKEGNYIKHIAGYKSLHGTSCTITGKPINFGIDNDDNIYFINYSDDYENISTHKVVVLDKNFNFVKHWNCFDDVTGIYIDSNNDVILGHESGIIIKYNNEGQELEKIITRETTGFIITGDAIGNFYRISEDKRAIGVIRRR